MSMEMQVKPNKALKIRLQLGSTDTSLYPQTKIYKESDDSLVDTVNLTHTQSGLYVGLWTNDGVQQRYYTQTIIYTDSGYTSESPIDRPDSDSINVGFLDGGGAVVLGSSGGRVIQKELTKKEVSMIVDEVVKRIKPELDKKSEYNPAKDKVLFDFPQIDFTTLENSINDLSKYIEDIRLVVNNNDLKLLGEVKKIVSTLKSEWSGKDEKIDKQLGVVIDKLEESTSNLSDKLNKSEKQVDAVIKLAEMLDNKFSSVIPEYITQVLENTLSGKELSNLNSSMMFTKTMGRINTDMNMNSVRSAARAGNVAQVFQQLKGLPAKEKAEMFAELIEAYPTLIRKMALMAQKNA